MNEILAIDDNPTILRLLQTLLGAESYTLRLATNGATALTSARSQPPDLILLDLGLPGMNGYEVLQRLKEDQSTADVPVIVVSGVQEVVDKVKTFSLGAVDFVTKPFQAEELKSRISTHLRLRQLQADLARFNQELESLVQERTAALERTNEELAQEVHTRREAEVMIAQSERRYRSFVETAGSVIVGLTPDLRIMEWNHEAERLYGKSRGDVFDKNYLDLCIPDSERDGVREDIQKVLSGKPTRDFQNLVKSHQGVLRHISWNVDRLVDGNGNPIGIIAVGMDITERIRALEQVKASEVHYRTLVDHAPFCIHEIDLDGTFLTINPAGVHMMELREESELLGAPYLDAVAPTDRDRVQSLLSKAIQGTSSEFEFTVAGEGSPQYMASNFIPIKSPDGLTQKIMGISQDITQRKKTETALRESEERFDLAVRGTDAGIWDWDLRTNRVYFSPRWKSMLGYEDHEITDDLSEWETRLHPEDHDRAMVTVQEYLDGKTFQYELEHRLRHKEGTYRWILAKGVSTQDESGTQVRMSGSHLDITERKRGEEQLQETYNRLRELSRKLEQVEEAERKRIARELHDEFGQNLTALKFDISWLDRQVRRLGLDQSIPDFDQKIYGMKTLIDGGVRTIRQIVTTLRPTILDDLGLFAALEWLAKDFQSRTGTPCTFSNSASHMEELFHSEVSTAIFRITQELLTNVIRHAQASTVQIHVNAEGEVLSLNVTDNGLGLTSEHPTQLGGYGLAGIRERATLLGGNLDVVGEPGVGTRVMVSIPIDAFPSPIS